MSNRWTRIEGIVHEALAHAPGEREAFLDDACGNDVVLRREVGSLLQQASDAQSFLEAPAALPLLTGRQLGPYRIDEQIGAGGMGEVYRARDTKLGRDVAIKILPAFVGQDAERLARLGREARVLAALNHPHIGSIYGLEESDGIRGLVLELVDGETLADRIARGPLPIADAVRIAGQIADALQAAHDKGIVHRDLKPANIKIASGGSVKVLDFGLATPAPGQNSQTTLATEDGAVMGTPAYMSPEQARGEAVDTRTDVWAFGCVLYEMLTARRAFGGATASDAIAAVLKGEPDWSALPAATPSSVRRLLTRCLAKDPKRRLHSVADAQLDLDEILDGGGTAQSTLATRTVSHGRRSVPSRWLRWALGGVFALALGAAVYQYGRSSGAASPRETYLDDIELPEGTGVTYGMALSPDGTALAIAVQVRQPDGSVYPRLWVRYHQKSASWQRINGVDFGHSPFWSPDGKRLAFFADGKLERVDLPDGAPIVICNTNGRGGAWLDDGTIVFAQLDAGASGAGSPEAKSREGALMRVDENGGAPAVLMPLAEGQSAFRFPTIVSGRRFLYLARYTDPGRSELRVVSVDAPQQATSVVRTSSRGVYDRGFLFYAQEGVLIRRRFDPSAGQFQGQAVRLTAEGSQDGAGWVNDLPLSAGGGHVAVLSKPPRLTLLEWRARDGRLLRELGQAADQKTAEGSPDGSQVAIARRASGDVGYSIWVVDAESGVGHQRTKDHDDWVPVWAPGSQRIAFAGDRGPGGLQNLYGVNADGPPSIDRLVEKPAQLLPAGWTADARIFAWVNSEGKQPGIFVSQAGAAPDADPRPFRVGTTREDSPLDARVSPDGTRIAYTSRASGQFEVYVDTFPTPAARPERVSPGGGRYPRWRGDSRELYFVTGDELKAVAASPGTTATFGTPMSLFKLRSDGTAFSGVPYAAGPDGSKFLVLVPKSEPSTSIKLTLNWSAQSAR